MIPHLMIHDDSLRNGRLLIAEKRYDEAIPHLEKAFKALESEESCFHLGRCYDFKYALDKKHVKYLHFTKYWYQKATVTGHEQATLRLAHLCRKDEPKKAQKLLRIIAEKSPKAQQELYSLKMELASLF